MKSKTDPKMTFKYWETVHKHNFPWEKVVQGYWKRYPNPNSSHVFSEDFWEVKVLDDGRLYTKRCIMKTNKLPSWGSHFFSAKRVPVTEETIVDARNKTLTTYTRNIGLRYFMGTTEKIVFRASKDSDEVTLAEKQVWIESSVFGFQSAIRSFGIDRFKKNCVAATNGFNWKLEEIFRSKEKGFPPTGNAIKLNHSSRFEDGCPSNVQKFSLPS